MIASLPCYTAKNVNIQRGKGVFDRSIQGLLLLNERGFGREGSGLKLDLVYNPLGKLAFFVFIVSIPDLCTITYFHQYKMYFLQFEITVVLQNPGQASGHKNISILLLSCRTSYLQFSLILKTHALVL